MTKRRVFLAYSSTREVLATELKNNLQEFEVVLWSEKKWGGGTLLDNIINEIESCQYGIAILSCDDGRDSKGAAHWVPRDNVVLELGIFLGEFGKARTAIIRIEEPSNCMPTIPTDTQGWFTIDVDANASALSIQNALERIREHFRKKESEIIPSLVPHSASRRGFNVITMADAREHWGDFTGKFYCVNPSWHMEHRDPEWMAVHQKRYLNPNFDVANYIIDVDGGRDTQHEVNSHSTSNLRRSHDRYRHLQGMVWFLAELQKQHPEVWSDVQRKLKVYIRLGVRSEMTTFVGEYGDEQRGFMFVRGVNHEDPEYSVLEARSSSHVGKLCHRINDLKSGLDAFGPNELFTLHGQIIGKII